MQVSVVLLIHPITTVFSRRIWCSIWDYSDRYGWCYVWVLFRQAAVLYMSALYWRVFCVLYEYTMRAGGWYWRTPTCVTWTLTWAVLATCCWWTRDFPCATVARTRACGTVSSSATSAGNSRYRSELWLLCNI